eukprot:1862531-Prymnesium_polylepis.1
MLLAPVDQGNHHKSDHKAKEGVEKVLGVERRGPIDAVVRSQKALPDDTHGTQPRRDHCDALTVPPLVGASSVVAALLSAGFGGFGG